MERIFVSNVATGHVCVANCKICAAKDFEDALAERDAPMGLYRALSDREKAALDARHSRGLQTHRDAPDAPLRLPRGVLAR
jgi:hypothetical protein